MFAHFALADIAVLGGYAAIIVVTGVALNRRTQSTQSFFLGSRQMPVWAVAISVLATSQSAATFLGGPDQGYRGDLTYLSTNLAAIIGALLVATFLLPRYYQHRVFTVYELLAVRFGDNSKRHAALFYLFGRLFASGARLYMAALAIAMLLYGNIAPLSVLTSIALLAIVGLVYTLAGGIRTVIYTDVIQAGLYISAALALVISLIHFIPADLSHILQALQQPAPGATSKLRLLNWSWDFSPSGVFSMGSVLTGFVLLNVAAFGLDQDMTQRLLTCHNKRKATHAMLWSTVVGIPVIALFMFAGMLLFIVYQRPDIMHDKLALFDGKTETVFLHYVFTGLAPGLKGLVTVGIIAAALSTLNSGLNSMASVVVQDIYRPYRMRRLKQDDDAHFVLAARIAMALVAFGLSILAALCFYWQQYTQTPLLQFALGVMVFSYSGLLGVYFITLFSQRGNQHSVLAALISGFITPLLLQPYVQTWWLPAHWQVSLGFTWLLLIGTAVAMAVCALGQPLSIIRNNTYEPSA